jgi:hypothetical protein
VKPPLPEGRGFLGIRMKLLSWALAGHACYNIPSLAITDQDLRTIRSEVEDTWGYGRSLTRLQIGILDAVRLGSLPTRAGQFT